MEMQHIMLEKQLRPFLLKARFGLEKESQRVTLDGDLAKTDHPQVLGSRNYHPYIQTDFSETQVELITPVATTIQEALRFMEALHDVTLRSMESSEMLWPLSMPPILPEREEEIIIAKFEHHADVLYRRHLAKEYGKRKQMVSGIHFNFEFDEELLTQLFQRQTDCETMERFKSEVYMKVSRQYLRYRWLLTYLFGASPVAEGRYFRSCDEVPKQPVRSIRNSSFGYTNHEDVKVSYQNLCTYIEDIRRLVDTAVLSEEKEFYAPVRLRGGKKVSDLCESGIRYIELRNLDLDPFSRVGMEADTLTFIHFFLLYLLWEDEMEHADVQVETGDQLNNQVALEHPLSQTTALEEGRWLFTRMATFAKETGMTETLELIEVYQKQLDQPNLTLAGRMQQLTDDGTSNHELGVSRGRAYHIDAHEKPYQLAGYRGMELSTQIFLFDAIQKGINVEILDESDQFLKLHHNDHIEYVKNANMTSKDTYIVPLIMANKTVTKKVLAQAGFRVPQGMEFDTLESAAAAYAYFANQAFVVKPKSTNYGLGISIFKDGASEANYLESLRIAFSEDSSVLVEEFMEGTEYRFFVLDGAVKAIMLRVPANVIGDGTHTIEELVADKNQDPLRGTHHRSPLELIQLGDIERLMLTQQGLTVDSIPETGRIVYLRENSNISTGGDSIDVTDEIDPSYKEIAVAAVAALGAEICGIDLIIPDKEVTGLKKSTTYGIIEANFNPAMHMHVYPFAGTSRRLTMDVLRLLFPEVVR